MTKAEYEMTKHWCYIRCTPKNRCQECDIFKAYKEIYGDKEI
jgi:hypothetical protein